VVHAHQVHVMFRGRLAQPDFGVGHESLETVLYPPTEIPWREIAFPSVEFALRRFLDDQARGVRELHFADFDRPAWQRATPT
jgi:hypothetical protein